MKPHSKNRLLAKSNLMFFYLFIIGFGVGFYFNISSNEILSGGRYSSSDLKEVKKVRILCILNTTPKTHSSRAIHISKTWGKHCDKLVFASSETDVNLNAVGLNVTDNQNRVWGKLRHTMQYLYKNHLTDYDWFYKGEDDAFVVPENLRFMLSAYSPEDPIYFGYKFNTKEHKWGYFSLTSGYVMSRKTVRTFVEDVLTNEDFISGKDDKCRLNTDNLVEDYTVSICLDHYDIYAGDARDALKRERFSIWTPEKILFNEPDMLNWYWQRKYYYNDEGLTCCSNYSIAFHAAKANSQYGNYYLVYNLKPFGLQHNYPSPYRRSFSDVAKRLDMESKNETLRGF